MIPSSYRNQDCCKHCVHVFKFVCHDEGPDYYCHYDQSERPICGSLTMEGESFDLGFGELALRRYLRQSRKWDKWAKAHAVDGECVCDLYTKEVRG